VVLVMVELQVSRKHKGFFRVWTRGGGYLHRYEGRRKSFFSVKTPHDLVQSRDNVVHMLDVAWLYFIDRRTLESKYCRELWHQRILAAGVDAEINMVEEEHSTSSRKGWLTSYTHSSYPSRKQIKDNVT
jgi:hypothetical protein